MVAAFNPTFKPKVNNNTQGQTHHNNRRRPPLLPSDADNGVVTSRKPRSREVSSRYSSSSSTISITNSTSSSSSSSSNSAFSRTVPSTPSHPAIKRSQSVERSDRRRSATPLPPSRTTGEMSVVAKVLVSSTRSLSVSFQGESFPLPVNKAKASIRKVTPERPGTAGEMSTTTTAAAKLLISSRRSLSASFQGDSIPLRISKTKEAMKGSTPVRNQNEHSKPVDQQRWPGRSKQSNSLATRVIQQSMTDQMKDEFATDVESVSSGSSDAPKRGGGGPRGIIVPARFWQETTNRLKQIPEPVMMKPIIHRKITFEENPSINSTPISSSKGSRGGLSSPLRSAIRPLSPNKLGISSRSSPPSKGAPELQKQKPYLIRNSNIIFTPPILSFTSDVRRGKPGDNKIDDAHMLRLLHNRYLQWRFVNARAKNSMLGLEASAKKSLYNGWVSTAKLQYSVELRKLELQRLRHNLKLYYIIKGQLLFSDDWDSLCSDHSRFLSEATKALEATTIRLPLVSGATKVDIQDLKDAISSSADVMQAMTSNICSFLIKAQQTNSSVSELASIAAKEYDLINECNDLLSTFTALQVKDWSMRTHILQIKRESHLP
ncbi:QWRF motif-containing protein 2-like isoform X2 [Impatiens glandulifera]|uniref:QWRF motif-containing protein 2-like isoform X2 n=1 Tax=Impatiens glandulifera TaxID=253017 RepID=UPI001FB097E6|nr:QWRF motif-containing protein 2-like isoform X2 [Impatiens glandulifera]